MCKQLLWRRGIISEFKCAKKELGHRLSIVYGVGHRLSIVYGVGPFGHILFCNNYLSWCVLFYYKNMFSRYTCNYIQIINTYF